MTYYSTYDTPAGKLLATSKGDALTGIYFDGHKGGPEVGVDWIREDSRFAAVWSQLDEYFAGKRRNFDVPVILEGTDFQLAVWKLLREIPFGATTTYGRLAYLAGSPRSSRAVGAAVGRNPISIIVPCHRVLGSTGAITGYAGGLDNKRKLLALESE
jgi:methylated-DNA-[protein]-cysteine S-methyltransferase